MSGAAGETEDVAEDAAGGTGCLDRLRRLLGRDCVGGVRRAWAVPGTSPPKVATSFAMPGDWPSSGAAMRASPRAPFSAVIDSSGRDWPPAHWQRLRVQARSKGAG